MLLTRHRFQSYQYAKTYPKPPKSLEIARMIGYLCLFLATAGILSLSSPWWLMEGRLLLLNHTRDFTPLAYQSTEPTPTSIPQPTPSASPVPTPDPATLPFSIIIPKIAVESKVIPNVNPSDEEIYSSALKQGVAHALGTYFPSEEGLVYIFGHSTDFAWNVEQYNALFYQVKDLIPNDEVFLIHGTKRYTYKVTETVVVSPDDVSLINNNLHKEMLILQTCYPPGTTWQRLLVLAEPVKVEDVL